MTFDQYFEGTAKQTRSNNSDDWYAIVEDALSAADAASRLHRRKLEIGLMKPLPMIPEDDMVDLLSLGGKISLTSQKSSMSALTQKSVESSKSRTSWAHDQQLRTLKYSIDHAVSRRSSSVYDDDFDCPTSAECDDLDSWAGNYCFSDSSSMSSLRGKPYSRPSSYTSSTASEQRMSTGSSIVADRSKSVASSVYSIDTSVDSFGKSAKKGGMHSRGSSDSSLTALRKMPSKASTRVSFFDFSDDEQEEQKEVTVALSESASSYVNNLRKKAMSLRMATSKMSHARVKTMCMPARDGPALSTRLFRRSLTNLNRMSLSSVDYDLGMENELMLGAAASAKAKRILGLA